MFELLDGRPSAYQWDTGLYVDCTGLKETDQVHFCRPGQVLALHPAMQGETLAAPVPDELLQQAQPIIVFAYVQTATGEITRVSARLCVTARPKPPGYIASPTEALRWEHLQEQIENLQEQIGDLADPEAVQQIVEDYLAENPPTVTETDPTVPEWAKAAQKPSYTASEVGADPSGTAASQVSAHNTGTDTHSDIRLLISGLTDRLNALADSDDTTLDQLSEVVAYIKSNRELIAAITTDKVSVADIIDNLTTNVANKPLSAAQGVALKALIDAISIPDKLPNPNALTFTGGATGSYDGSAPLEVEIPSGGGAAGDYIPIPASAEVGQTIVVKAVDENGKPTEWETADFGGWDLITDITLTEDGSGNQLNVTRNDKGEDFEYRQCMVCISGTVIDGWPSGAYISIMLYESNKLTGSYADATLTRIPAGAGGTEYKTTVGMSIFGNLVRTIACGGSADTSSLIIRGESSIDTFRSIKMSGYGNNQWVSVPLAAGGRVVIYGRK